MLTVGPHGNSGITPRPEQRILVLRISWNLKGTREAVGMEICLV